MKATVRPFLSCAHITKGVDKGHSLWPKAAEALFEGGFCRPRTRFKRFLEFKNLHKGAASRQLAALPPLRGQAALALDLLTSSRGVLAQVYGSPW